jgi:hypothetical protein
MTDTALKGYKDGGGLEGITSTSQALDVNNINAIVPTGGYDYIALSYTGTNLTTVVYKSGGAGGTTIATLTLAYTGSVLDSVTRS